MNNKKGITLVALVITIIVLIIIASISVYSGISTVRYSKYNKAKSEFEIIQANMNEWYTEYSNFVTDSQKSKAQKQYEFIQNHGVATNHSSCDQNTLTKTVQATGITTNDFMFLSKDYLKTNFGMDFNFEFLISIPKRKVILFGGVSYNGKTYFSADGTEDIGGFSTLTVETVQPIKSIDFEIDKNDERKEIIIKDIVFKDNNSKTVNVNKFIVQYRVLGTEIWYDAKVTEYEEEGNTKYKFQITESAAYEVKILTLDKMTESETRKIKFNAITFVEEQINFLEQEEMIDTEIKLFDEINRNKDFIIRFTIAQFGNNEDKGTLINSMREDNTQLYPGFVFRYDATRQGGPAWFFQFNAVASNSQKFYYTAEQLLGNEVVITRENGIIYIKVGNGAKTKVVDLNSVNTTNFYNQISDVTLTLGSSLINGASARFFSGIVTNVEISLINPKTIIRKERELYALEENLVLTKANSKYLVFDGLTELPDIRLNSEDNLSKDFEIKIRVEGFGTQFANQDTILSTKLEIKGSTAVAPGFTFRRASTSNMEFKGNTSPYGSKANSYFLGKTVTIKRTSGIYTVQIEGENPKTFTINNPTKPNDAPLTVGCIKYTNGTIDRVVECTISQLSIKIYEEEEV